MKNSMNTTAQILMVRPVNFAFNVQTAGSNSFQDEKAKNLDVQQSALQEFDGLVELLRANGVQVLVIDDKPSPHTPDSIFPNNWISTHNDGKVFIYPMEANNRRLERRPEFLQELHNKFEIHSEIDLTYLESERKYLEGTGSMVLDRQNKLAYACISPRTDEQALSIFCDLSGYRPITFHAFSQRGKAIYHTNVMMCIGNSFAAVCLDSIPDNAERHSITKSLTESGKEIIPISYEQLKHFAGNMLELQSSKGDSLLVMSQQAYESLSQTQINALSRYTRLVYSPLNTIENCGGGSARCMIAEIYLERTDV